MFHTLQNILITANGAWKLGGFGFAISTEQASGDFASVPAFHYAVSVHKIRNQKKKLINLYF